MAFVSMSPAPVNQGAVMAPYPGSDPNQQMLAWILQNAGKVATTLKGQQDEAKIAELLMGTPAQMGNALPGAGPDALRGIAPPQPGLMPDMDPRMIEAALLMPGGREALMSAALKRAMPEPKAPIKAGPGDVFLDPNTMQPITSIPGEVEAPQTRDILRGDRRVFQEFVNGQWVDVGEGPAFAPPSQVNVNTGEGGIKVPAGYMLAPDGASVVPIPGGPAESATGPVAASLALIPGALADLPAIEGTLFPGGEFSAQVAGMMYVPGTAASGIATAMQAGTMAILRNESGGAITDQELANKLDTYRPKPWDTPDVARGKFERYKRDLANVKNVAERGGSPAPDVPPAPAPTGQPGPVESFMGSALDMLGGSAPGAPAPGTVEDSYRFKGGDPADPNNWEPI